MQPKNSELFAIGLGNNPQYNKIRITSPDLDQVVHENPLNINKKEKQT